MKVQAVCCASFQQSVRRAAGVLPLLSPPLQLETFKPAMLEGYDFLYFKLHGLPGQAFWYGDNWVTAFSADQLRQADLGSAGVFVANCHLYEVVGDQRMPGEMLRALMDAGARFVVGGAGPNWALKKRVFGADMLGWLFRGAIQRGYRPQAALEAAKKRLRKGRQNRYIRDALEFTMFERELRA